MTLPKPLPFAGATGGSVNLAPLGPRAPEPLAGAERDELTALVMRIKQADTRHRAPLAPAKNVPTAAAQQWAENWQLPREVHEYFTIETK